MHMFSQQLSSLLQRLFQSIARTTRSATADESLASVKNPRALCLIVWMGVMISTPMSTSAAANFEWHSLDDIRRTAVTFIEQRSERPGQAAVVTAGALDSRLRLKRCDTALVPYLPPGTKVGANTTVGVRCKGPKPWKLFVPVRVGVSAPILVATRPLARGAVLTPDDVMAVHRELNTLHSGYIKAGEPVAGLVLKRRLPEGQALRPELLTTPQVIRRGQSLTIVSADRTGSVAIRMAGIALSDGRMGERIRVKNQSSGRTIEGVVRSSERVEIGF